MARIKENKEILMAKIILEHYRYIKKVSDLSAEEFFEQINHINPSIFSAFKNQSIIEVKNIISDYLTLINRVLKEMKNACYSKSKAFLDTEAKAELKKEYLFIKSMYINQKTMSNEQLAEYLKTDKDHLCRLHYKALQNFAKRFNGKAAKMNLKYNLNSCDKRIIEIMRLNKMTIKSQKTA